MRSPTKKALVCPECSTSMDRVEKNGHEVDVCGYCQAVWLDPGEVRSLTARNGFDLDRFEQPLTANQRPVPGFRCLCCQRDLHFVSSQGVAASVCTFGSVLLSGDAVRQIEGIAKARFGPTGLGFDIASNVAAEGAGHLAVGFLEVVADFLAGLSF